MTTLPPPESHQYRQVAESFGLDPVRYDRARPRYPDALIERLLAESPGRRVLDVGCGTGIVARQLQAAGAEVLGLDVDERMARVARSHGLEVVISPFEGWDGGGRTFDAVVAGQTWHWIDPVPGAATAAEVLRPGGRLAVFWNAMQVPPALAEAFSTVYRQVMPEGLGGRLAGAWTATGDAYAVMCGRAADGIRAAGGFGRPEQWRFDRDQEYTRAQWLDLVPTAGGHQLLPPEQLGALLAGLGAAVARAGGAFTMHYETVVVTAVRPEPDR